MPSCMSRPSSFQPVHGQLLNVSDYLWTTSLEEPLRHLISLRASQINGCASCLAMHVRDLRNAGEREDRIAVVPAWRETDWFSPRERAALAWTEALTVIGEHGISDDLFTEANAVFSERELADLTLAVILINGWNRLNIAFHSQPDHFTVEANIPAVATV